MPYNVAHFICHDLGRRLACYGDPTIPSPTLDRFAAEGIRFSNYFAASTPCSPSRGCIMSGRYAHSNGLIGLVNRGWDMPESETTIVDCLNGAGYYTLNIGFQHERKDIRHNHYAAEWHESIDAKAVAGHFAETLESLPKPFYVNMGTGEVHLPFDRPDYTFPDPAEVAVPPYLPDTPDVRQELAYFQGAIRYLDEAFGMVLEAIEAAGRADDTIVVFTTDHGEAFPGAKSTLYDPGIGTTLLMRFPQGPMAVHDALLSNIDLAPTLLDALGIDIPKRMQGRSFLGLITGAPYEPRECIFAEKNFHDEYDPVRMVRTPRYKYIRSFTDQNLIALPIDIRRSIAANTLRPGALDPRPKDQLFDLETDPDEMENRIADPSLAAVSADLSARLDLWMRETDDPLLERVDLPYPPEQFRDRH